MLLARFPGIRRLAAAGLVALAASAAPVRAERQIVDLHRLDAYFELFAADSNVPWKPTAVRLDTYSSAPVSFSVYQVDPADVLTAGSNVRPRAIVDAGRRPLLSFTFTPPGGYQFQSSEVDVPLGSREGFFVVEARRGRVGEQVWINRTRVGLVVKQTPNALLLYGADLGIGRTARAHARAAGREPQLRDGDDRRRRPGAVEPLAAPGLRHRAVGQQLRVRQPAAAGAAAVNDRRRAHGLGGRARGRRRARGRLRADPRARRAAREHRERDGVAALGSALDRRAARAARRSGRVRRVVRGSGGRRVRRVHGAGAGGRRRGRRDGCTWTRTPRASRCR